MSQSPQWNSHAAQQMTGGVKMFDPSQFSTQGQQSTLYNNTNSTQPQTYVPSSVGTSIPSGEQFQNFQPNNNAWNSWGSWGGEGEGVSGSETVTHPPVNAHTPGEASSVYPPQQSEQYGQWYWDPNTQQHVQYGQNYQEQGIANNSAGHQQQWQGHQGYNQTQDQSHNVQTSQHQNSLYNVYDHHQQVTNERTSTPNTSTLPPDLQTPPQFSGEDSQFTPNTAFQPVPQEVDVSQSQPVVVDSNNVNNYFDNSANQMFVPFSSGQESNNPSNQFLGVPHDMHRTDSLISNSSLVTKDSANNSLDQDELIEKMAGEFQSASLNQSPGGNDQQSPQVPQAPPMDAKTGNPQDEEHQSPLNDWEFVSSVPSSSSQHSRQSSLENNVNFPSQPPPVSQLGVQQSTSDSLDPYNVNISATSHSDTSSSALSSSVSDTPPSTTTSGASSLATSLNNPPGSLHPPPPPPSSSAGLTDSNASNPFRKASPKPETSKDNQDPATLSSPIFQPIQQSPEKMSTSTASTVQDLPEPVSSSSNQLPFQTDQIQANERKPAPPVSTGSSKNPEPSDPKDRRSYPTSTGYKAKEDSKTLPEASKPPINPVPREVPHSSPRKHNSAFKPVPRAKHNMSPATTLWDDIAPPAVGVHLAPAAPSVTEASSNMSVSKSRSSSPSPPKTSGRSARMDERREGKEHRMGSDSENLSDSSRKFRDRRIGSNSWRKDDDNRSLDSLDEVNSKMDSYRDRRYKDRYAARESVYDKDRPASRNDYRDRPASRNDYRDDYRGRYRGYRQYDDYHHYERYERPRSRNNEHDGQDADRPRSRADYDREAYYRDRYRGYDYDPRRRYYYDDHRGYNELDYVYSQGYYDEYYGHHARYSDYYQPYGGETDRYSHRSFSPSRDQVAANEEAEQSYDAQGRLSRPTSRQGEDYSYGRDEHDGRHAYYYGYPGYDYYAHGYGYDPYASYQDTSYHRLTPPKYSIPHMKAAFGVNGQLIKVLPNRPADGQPALVEVQEIESMLADVKGAEEVKEFPGPLIRGETHKNDILLFCQRKAKSCSEDINMMDRESAELIWRLLEVLIKQNGTVIGTDISDLLLEGHEPTTHEYSANGMKIASSLDNIDTTIDEGEDKVTADRTVINKTKSREDITDRFRHLLLYGRKKDALEWAMKNDIWGHALFLASKMDTRTHANVMTKFANGAMKMNDPLQTLYQLMSGRQPAAVTCMSDERWGDWRPHLAMILSNHTSKTDIDRKSIATLGDTLAAKGCLYASHFCYLMAQVNFGTFTKKTSKIVLIGSSHNLSLEKFASNQAIQCTEIYEYAQSLGNASFVLPHLQLFKFLYACRLAEFGLSQEALHYCEVISRNVQRSPVYYQSSFVKSLYELANRLKYHDPARQHESDDAADPEWLQQLAVVRHGYDDGSIQPISGSATPAGFGGTTNSSDSGEVAEYTSNTPSFSSNQYQNYGQDGTYTDQSYQQQYYGQGQYDQNQGYYQQGQEQSQYQQVQEQYQQTSSGSQEQTTDNSMVEGQSSDYLQKLQEYNQQWSQYTQQQGYNTDTVDTSGTTNTNQAYDYNAGNQNSYGGYQGYYQHQSNDVNQSGYHQEPRNSIASTQSLATEEDEEEDEEGDNLHNQTNSFDYFGQAGSQQIVAPNSRLRAGSTSSSSGRPARQRTTSGSSTGSISAANPKPKSSNTNQTNEKSKQRPNEESGGWLKMFGWGKSKPKAKQIILPDDKDPQIVWDPKTKKWTNPNEEETSTPSAPPPKDTDLMGKSSMNGSAPPPMGGPPSANRFSLKSAGGARNQYVDVLNPKANPSPVPPNLVSSVPQSTANTNIYNPLGGTGATTSSYSSQAAPENKHLEVPQTNQNMSRSSSMSSLSREVQELTEQTDPPSNTNAPQSSGPPGMPVLFDPTQFQQPAQPQADNRQKPGMKYGQRRKYPK